MTSFHGLSSPQELKDTWVNLTEGQGIGGVNVIWNFTESTLSQLKDGPNIVNILYKYIGNNTGHYVLIFKRQLAKRLASFIYFDPLATLPPEWVSKEIYDTFNAKVVVDTSGEQNINGNSCGYRCLYKALMYSLNFPPHDTVIINGLNVLTPIPDKTIQKTKRVFKILNELKGEQ